MGQTAGSKANVRTFLKRTILTSAVACNEKDEGRPSQFKFEGGY